jgi:flavin reductase (DIM6/NTAB) family NADH-FMN oxidoreductase RutF
MKKDLGLVQAVYPMPVLMVAAYDENRKVNAMNVAWGQICEDDKIILFIGEGKKTWLNIKASKAFTVSLADRDHMKEADFLGIATGNKMEDKFERTGLHAKKSDKVAENDIGIMGNCSLVVYSYDGNEPILVGYDIKPIDFDIKELL